MQPFLDSALLLLLGLGLGVASSGVAQSPASVPLPQADESANALAGGVPQEFTIDLRAGDYLEVRAEQLGIDLVLRLYDAHRRMLFEIDSPTGEWDTEVLVAIVEASGALRLEIASLDTQARGQYQLRVTHAAAGDVERRRAAAAALFRAAELQHIAGEAEAAVARYRGALAAWERLGDASWEARCLRRIGTLQLDYRAAADALDPLRRAAAFAESLRWDERALSLYLLGYAYVRLDLFDQAVSHLSRARALRDEHADLAGVVEADLYLGQSFVQLQQVDTALEVYERAAELAARTRKPGLEAQVAGHLGDLLLDLGRTDDALDAFARAERFATAAGDEQLLADAWERKGQLLLQLGQADEALRVVSAAAEKRRAFTEDVGLPVDLTSRGQALLALGRVAEARASYREALDLFVQLDMPRWAPAARLGLARAARADGRLDEALALVAESVAANRSQTNDSALAAALSEHAALLRATGALDAAVAVAEEAATLYERLRESTASLESRSTYFASVLQHFELYVDLLMERHAHAPAHGYDVQALAVSERARARSLLDQLAESPQRIRRAADPALVAAEGELEERITRLEQERLERLSATPVQPALLAEIDALERGAIAELERVRRKIRVSGLHAIGGQVERSTLGLAEIRARVLDPGTVLVVYELGEERSFLWAATADRFVSATLPPRAEISTLVNRAVRGLARSQHREGEQTTRALLCQLGAQLLDPVRELLAGRRLAIVADESLHQWPFAVLPEPGGADCREAPPLIAAHEIVLLPSASALVEQRARHASRGSAAAKGVAVVADPVFDPADERVSARPTTATQSQARWAEEEGDLVRAASALEWNGPPPRLRYTREEAQDIIDLARDGTAFMDYAATKSLVLGGELADYRIVHFATHAILHPDRPELSGLVLSLVDAQGHWQDGFVRAHELYGLELAAEMVVLSACDTALGRELRGEGPASLARGFFAAGAERVVMSLWPVHDRSTALLMNHFYRHLLHDGQRPAEALRMAQLALLADPRWRAPAYWAGFELEGDWR